MLVDSRLQLVEQVQAAVGGVHQHAAAVLGVGGPLHHRLGHHAVDQLRQRGRVDAFASSSAEGKGCSLLHVAWSEGLGVRLPSLFELWQPVCDLIPRRA